MPSQSPSVPWQREWQTLRKKVSRKRVTFNEKSFVKNSITSNREWLSLTPSETISAGNRHFALLQIANKNNNRELANKTKNFHLTLLRKSSIPISFPEFKILVKSVVCHIDVLGLITYAGDIYFWGHNLGLIPNQPEWIAKPHQLYLTQGKKIEKLCLRNTELAVLYTDRSVYYGLLDNNSKKLTSIEIPILAVDIAINGECQQLAIVTYNGKLHRLTANGYLDEIVIPDKMKSVSMGCGYGGCLTQKGKVYMWGKNKYGQLGFGHLRDMSPTLLELPEPIKFFRCHQLTRDNPAVTTAISTEGNLYIWGENYLDQIVASEKIEGLPGIHQGSRSLIISRPIHISIGSPIKEITVGLGFALAISPKKENNDDQETTIRVWGKEIS